MNKTDSNRLNAQNSTGPGDTTLTRFNAVKHGLLAKGITELDDSDAYESLLQRLTLSYDPVGDLEIFLVRRIAFCMTRLDRAARLEANYINAEIHPPSQEQDCLAPITAEHGLSTAVGALSAINLVSGFQRYETAIENKLYRAIHELERRQRIRKGEFVPAPQSLDVSIHSEVNAKLRLAIDRPGPMVGVCASVTRNGNSCGGASTACETRRTYCGLLRPTDSTTSRIDLITRSGSSSRIQ